MKQARNDNKSTKQKTDHLDLVRQAFSIAELALTLGISERQLRLMCYRGTLEHCRIGRRLLVTPEQLQKFLHAHSKHGRR